MFKAGRQQREGKRAELDSSPAVEFILKFNPTEEANSCQRYKNTEIIQRTVILGINNVHTSAAEGHAGTQTGPP